MDSNSYFESFFDLSYLFNGLIRECILVKSEVNNANNECFIIGDYAFKLNSVDHLSKSELKELGQEVYNYEILKDL